MSVSEIKPDGLNSSKLQTRLFVSAALYGLFICVLVYSSFILEKGFGINVPCALIAFYCAVFTSIKGTEKHFNADSIFMLLLLLGFSAAFVMFNDGFMLFVDFIAMAVLATSQLSVMLGTDNGRFFTFEFIPEIFGIGFVRSFSSIGAAFSAFFGKSSETKGVKGVIKGILLAAAITLPIVIILLVLLSSADEVFKASLTKMFTPDFLRDSILNILMYVVITTMTISLLWWMCFRRNEGMRVEIRERKGFPFNAIAVISLLVAVNAVLWVFAYVQSKYLFGGAVLPDSMTYSEYARQGFWQLLAASVLVFAILVAVAAYVKTVKGGIRAFVRILGVGICLGDFGLLISAFYRMVMYEQIYLFTRQRVLAQAFMVLIAICLVIFLIKLFSERFKYGKAIFYTVICWLLAVNFLNVDGFIAKNNIGMASKKHGEEVAEDIDWEYLLSLSPDAVPYYADEITDAYLSITHEEWDEIIDYCYMDELVSMSDRLSRARDLRQWNYGRAKAIAAFESNDLFEKIRLKAEEMELWYNEIYDTYEEDPYYEVEDGDYGG